MYSAPDMRSQAEMGHYDRSSERDDLSALIVVKTCSDGK